MITPSMTRGMTPIMTLVRSFRICAFGVALATAATAAPAFAAPDASASPAQQVDNWCRALAQNPAAKMTDYIVVSPALRAKETELALVDSQFAFAMTSYGKVSECELIREAKAGSRMWRGQYVMNLRDLGLYVELHFYRRDGGWALNQYKFNDVGAGLYDD